MDSVYNVKAVCYSVC